MKNLKFEIYFNEEEPKNKYQPQIGQKMARVFWRDRVNKHVIQHDEYGEYLMVPNYLNPSKSIFAEDFTRRIKDAVESIKNGDGDCIEMSSSLYHSIFLHYYLDREVGEKLRQKSIEGFKDAKFETYIRCSGSFGGFFLSEGDKLSSVAFSKDDKRMIFDSDEEALKEIEKIYSEAEKIISERSYEKESFPESELERTAFFFIRDERNDETGEECIYVHKSLEVAQDIRKE